MSVAGTTPEGARTEREAALMVRSMFGRIAGRYDIANHLLSANVDRFWRNRTVARVRHILKRSDARVADLACGTGDLLIALERTAGRSLIGLDFSRPMLTQAKEKIENGRLRSKLIESDALALPLADKSLDLITIAFGYRNLASYRGGLAEMRRVLRLGGTLAILEFTTPPNAGFAVLYDWYSRKVLPALGGAISGVPGAYKYLPESVRKFPDAPELAALMAEAGFESVEWEYLSFGIAALHIAKTPEANAPDEAAIRSGNPRSGD